MNACMAGFRRRRTPLGSSIFFLAGVLLLLSGCAHVISEQVRLEVDTSLDYRTLAADPQAYAGRMVLLGGTIVQTTPRTGDTEIEVVQKELKSTGEPRMTDVSEGRFLVVVDRFLDPAIYKADRDLTVAGTVQGAAVRRIGETDYRYPVIAAKEIHLWRQPLPPAAPGTPYWYPQWNWWFYQDYRYRR